MYLLLVGYLGRTKYSAGFKYMQSILTSKKTVFIKGRNSKGRKREKRRGGREREKEASPLRMSSLLWSEKRQAWRNDSNRTVTILNLLLIAAWFSPGENVMKKYLLFKSIHFHNSGERHQVKPIPFYRCGK